MHNSRNVVIGQNCKRIYSIVYNKCLTIAIGERKHVYSKHIQTILRTSKGVIHNIVSASYISNYKGKLDYFGVAVRLG